ncbi:MAG: DUF4440 domain-containing protein [Elusimicrobia bacterium]|nr:DUF4440 domain-containing protein [Elusimicrobiota bacterium]
MAEENLFEELLKKLEQRLLEPGIRKSAAQVGALLADDFREFASSGKTYNKIQTIELLQNSPAADSTLEDFKTVILAPDVVLATFVYFRGATHDRPAAKSIRSSLWKRMEGRWQMVFHQGTLCSE